MAVRAIGAGNLLWSKNVQLYIVAVSFGQWPRVSSYWFSLSPDRLGLVFFQPSREFGKAEAVGSIGRMPKRVSSLCD